jgi:hypothetical protein
MNDEKFDAEALIDALAPSLGLVWTAESRAQVAIHLNIAWGHAQILFAAPLDDREEPAPVFTP